MTVQAALKQWGALIGEAHVLTSTQAQERYGRCTTGSSRRIAGALRITQREQVPPAVRIANQFRVPLYPISTGHNWGYGSALPVMDDCVILDLAGLDRIIDFDSQSGVVTVEPGVTQGKLARFLKEHNHPFLVPVTGAGPRCSVVGNALERGYGITPYADHFLAVTALEAVMANGTLYRSALTEAGGEPVDRAFKWGFGPYLDGLFTQSGMGVVVQMSIALARRPEAVKAFFFGLEDPKALGQLVQKVRDILRGYSGIVGGINLMNAQRILAMSTAYPKNDPRAEPYISEQLLTELCRSNFVSSWTGMGTLYGPAGVVKAAQKGIRRILRPLASRLVFISPAAARTMAGLTRVMPRILGSRLGRPLQTLQKSLELVDGWPNETALPLCYWRGGRRPQEGLALDPARDGCGISWYAPLVPMVPDKVEHFIGMVTDIMHRYGMEPLITLTSVSDRCFDSTVPLLFDLHDERARANANECQTALLNEGRSKGFIPYRVGIQTMTWLPRDDAPYWQVVRAIKKTLDPNNIIAPGRYS